MKTRFYSKTVFDTLMQAYKPFLLKIVFTMLFGFLGRLIFLSNANLIGHFIDSSIVLSPATLNQLLLKLTVFLITAFVFTIGFRIIFSRLSAEAVSRIYDETTYRVSRLPVLFFDDQPVGKITTRFSSDYGNVFRLFGGPLAEFFSILFDLISIVILLYLINPLFLVTVFISSLFYFYILKNNQIRLRESRREVSTNRAPSISHFSETVQGATIIRQNNKFNIFQSKFSQYDDLYLKSKWKVFWFVTRFSLELNLLSTLLFAVNSLICIQLIKNGSLGVGQTGVVLSFTLLATYTLQMFFEWFSQFEEALTGVEKMDEYLRLPLEKGSQLPTQAQFKTGQPIKTTPSDQIHSPDKHLTQKTSHANSINQSVPYELEVNHLNFKYPHSEKQILHSISFKLKQGEKLGIIGRTGSGKSTLIAALLQMYPIETGDILVNGQKNSDIEAHRSLFSVISQDQLFISGTVQDNLDLFKKFDSSQIKMILNQVGLNFPLKFKITEKGYNLSQGERQLLSLARGLLQNASIFIFDEATSNVDPLSETLMNQALENLLSNKTQIRIAHRLQTVENCEQILWLDNGKINKLGPAKEVLEAFSQKR